MQMEVYAADALHLIWQTSLRMCCRFQKVPQVSFLSLCCSLAFTWAYLQGVGWERRS